MDYADVVERRVGEGAFQPNGPLSRVQPGPVWLEEAPSYFLNTSFNTPASRIPAFRICCWAVGPKAG